MKKQFSLFAAIQLCIIGSVSGQFSGFTDHTSPTVLQQGAIENNYIWLATTGGVVKFDTISKTTTFLNSFNSGLPCNYIFSLAIDYMGNKWFGTGGNPTGYYEATSSGRGLAKYNGTVWTIYNTANSGLPNNSVRSLYSQADTIWAGTNGGGLAKFYGSTWTVFNRLNSGLPSDTVSSIVKDANGLSWIATFRGVASFNGTSWTVYNASNSGLPGDTVRTIAIGPNNEKWIGTNRGIAKFNDTAWTTYTTANSGLPYRNVVEIVPETDGSIWFCTYGLAETYGGGVGKFNGTTWTVYNSSNSGLPRNNVSVVLLDASGKKWITSERGSKGGDGTAQMNRFNGTSGWETFDLHPNKLLVNIHYCIEKDAAGALWIGGEKSGITKFDGTTWTNYNTDNSALVDDDNYSIRFDSNGKLWSSHDRGRITKFDGTTFVKYNTPTGILDDPYAMVIDAANIKWIGCRGTGVFSFDETDTTWTSYNTSTSGLPHDYVNCIKIDAAGNKWIGTNGGLAKFDGTTWTVYTTATSGLPHNIVRDIDIDQFGNLWIATFNGLAKFTGTVWTVYSTSGTALPSSKIYTVSIDSYDTKWIGTYTGAAKLSGTTWTSLFSFSGAPYTYTNCIDFTTTGDVWFATQGLGVLQYANGLTTGVPSLVSASSELSNYPNPLENITTITFTDENINSIYTLTIFDNLGREISVPFSFTLDNNRRSFKIYAEDLKSGIYFYTITSQGEKRNGKMIVQK